MKDFNQQITRNERGDPRTFAIIGVAQEAHRQLGCGFLEAVYQEALALEFTAQGVPFKREVELPVFYKGKRINVTYKADFICFDSIIVELKALSKLTGIEESQTLNYLKATGYEVGLLFNFGTKSLEYKRFVFSKSV